MRTALLIAVLASAVCGAATASPESIQWVKSFDGAMAEARKTNSLVLLDFYADWCDGCKRLERVTWADAGIVKLMDQFVPLKLNGAKEGRLLAKKFDVGAFPTLLFINGAGEVEGTISGYTPPEDMAPRLTRIVQAHREFPELLERTKGNPDDPASAAKLAAIYAGRGDIEKARALLRVAEKDPAGSGAFLGESLSSVGDYYQNLGKYDRAIPYFRRAGRVGKTPDKVAYALISEAACYLQSTRPKAAIAPLESLLKLDGAPKQWVKQGRQLLEQAQKSQ